MKVSPFYQWKGWPLMTVVPRPRQAGLVLVLGWGWVWVFLLGLCNLIRQEQVGNFAPPRAGISK
jgi:hypothetical protein